MTPEYRILADDNDVTASFRGQLVSMTITDKQGTDSDELEFIVSDAGGRVVLPRRGVMIRVAIGWQGQPLTDKGTYQVDEVEHSGPPDQVRVKGRAAQMQGKIKSQRDDSYTGQTLGQILTAVAQRHGIKPAIDPTLAAQPIAHIDQTNESDLNFITRLGKDYGATATVKDGRLVFLPAGSGQSASGKPLPPATLTRRQGVSHSFTISDREGGDSGVQAQWRDLGAAETKTAVAGSTDGPVKTLKTVYPTPAEATAAAMAVKTEAKRKQREIRITCDRGMPELIAGQPIRLSGFRAEIGEVPWVVEECTHILTGDQGLQTSFTAHG